LKIQTFPGQTYQAITSSVNDKEWTKSSLANLNSPNIMFGWLSYKSCWSSEDKWLKIDYGQG